MPTLTDTLKQMVDELEIERHVTEATEAAEKAFRQALEKAGDYAHSHSDDIHQLLDKAGATIDEKTDGKYADTWDKVRDQIAKAWAKLAEQRPDGGEVVDLTARVSKDDDVN